MSDEVPAYVVDVLGAETTVTAVERFSSGERHRTYRVAYLDERGEADAVVVRVSLADSVGEREQASREAAVLGVVGGVVGPRLLDFRVESPWFDAPVICVEHVEGEERDLGRAAVVDLEALGGLLARVHALPTDAVSTSTPTPTSTDVLSYARDWVAGIVARLAAVEPALPPAVRAEVEPARVGLEHRRATVAEARGFDGGSIVLLHADASSPNILWRPEPVLIDWEYARLGDPADEIGYVFGQHDLDRARRDALWRGYGGDEGVRDRVRWWEPVVLLASATWWFERWRERRDAGVGGETDASVPKDATYYLDNALARLRRAQSPR